MTDKTLIKDLEKLLNKNIDLHMFPYQKGNSLRIGKSVIRKTKKGYSVYDCAENKLVAQTFCKTSAIALAKTINAGKSNKNILELDKIIQKNYNDCVFYLHSITMTSDQQKKEIVRSRLDISKAITQKAKAKLDRVIFQER